MMKKKLLPIVLVGALAAAFISASCSSEDAGESVYGSESGTAGSGQGGGTDKLVDNTGVATPECMALSEEDLRSRFKGGDSTPAAIILTKITPENRTILPQGTSAEGRANYAILEFAVVNKNSVVIPRQGVNFSVNNSTVKLSATKAYSTCEEDSKVRVVAYAGNVPGPFNVTASVGDIKVISDAITIGSDQNSQRGLTVGPEAGKAVGGCDGEKFGDTLKISAVLSDKNGNYVAKGTKVYFTTDEGAIEPTCAADDKSGCSVEFRVQNPIKTCKATITATSYSAEGLLKAVTQVQMGSVRPSKVVFTIPNEGSSGYRTCTLLKVENFLQDQTRCFLRKDVVYGRDVPSIRVDLYGRFDDIGLKGDTSVKIEVPQSSSGSGGATGGDAGSAAVAPKISPDKVPPTGGPTSHEITGKFTESPFSLVTESGDGGSKYTETVRLPVR